MNIQQWQQSGHYLTLGGNNIFYQVSGSTVPLLLIHGYPTASWDYHKIWPALIARFNCITLDMLGYGFSDKPRQNYSIFAQADLYCALLEHLNIKQCHVISHDYGDTVAQELLARQNEGSLSFEMLSLNLLNGGLFPEMHRPVLTQKLLLSPLGGLLVRIMNRKTLAKNMAKVFGPDSQPSEQEIDEFWQLIKANDGHLVMHRLIHYINERHKNRQRWVGALQSSAIPMQLTCGMLDPISGAHMVEHYQKLVPNPEVVCLDDIGHYPQIEAPQRVISAILGAIEQVESQRQDKSGGN